MKARLIAPLTVLVALSIAAAACAQGQLFPWPSLKHAFDPKLDKLLTHKIPRTVIWSWEHSDDLAFIDASKAAVAFYAGTIVLGRDNATMHKRKNPIHINDQTVSFPAFRIETAHLDEAITDEAFARALEIIIPFVQSEKTGAVQIDFDATERDRKTYLKFLRDLRKRLPADTALSITALASWCLYDKWLQQAPIDETVAMMFSMGREKGEALTALKKMSLDSGAPCLQSLGISINEATTNAALEHNHCFTQAPRVYVFSSLGWTQSRYDTIMAELKR